MNRVDRHGATDADAELITLCVCHIGLAGTPDLAEFPKCREHIQGSSYRWSCIAIVSASCGRFQSVDPGHRCFSVPWSARFRSSSRAPKISRRALFQPDTSASGV